MLLLLLPSLHWNCGMFFFHSASCPQSEHVCHIHLQFFFFFYPSPDATKNFLFFLLHSATTTISLFTSCNFDIFFFLRFWTILIMNKWHEVGKNGNIQKCDWWSMRVKKKNSRNINSCTERICVFSVALQNNNIHISTDFQLKVWFCVVLVVACLPAGFCRRDDRTNCFSKEILTCIRLKFVFLFS